MLLRLRWRELFARFAEKEHCSREKLLMAAVNGRTVVHTEIHFEEKFILIFNSQISIINSQLNFVSLQFVFFKAN